MKDKILGVYKPAGMTSFQVIRIIRKATNTKRVGHAGTLDPQARGVLVIGVGREATKQLSTIVKGEKEYLAKIRFGAKSTTYDREGEISKVKFEKIPTLTEVEQALTHFKRKISQTPPLFSALKVKGTPAYKLARQGKKFALKPRKVFIKEVETVNYKWPYLTLKVTTGPGVYIRSLANDLGEKLGTGGYLAELERTRVGDFTKGQALPLEHFTKKF